MEQLTIFPPINENYHDFAREVMATKYHPDGTTSRHGLRSITPPIACRISALVYIIISMLISSGIIPYPLRMNPKYTDIVAQVIKSVKSDPVVMTLFDKNRLYPVHARRDVSDEEYLHSKNIFLMLLFNKSEFAKQQDPIGIGNVSHYFVIVRREDGKLYLISSYGSSLCILQKEVELNLAEWVKFVRDFNNPNTEEKLANKSLQDFMRKYFLPIDKKSTTLYKPGEDDKDYKGDIEAAIQDDINSYNDLEHEIISVDNIFDLLHHHIDKIALDIANTKAKVTQTTEHLDELFEGPVTRSQLKAEEQTPRPRTRSLAESKGGRIKRKSKKRKNTRIKRLRMNTTYNKIKK